MGIKTATLTSLTGQLKINIIKHINMLVQNNVLCKVFFFHVEVKYKSENRVDIKEYIVLRKDKTRLVFMPINTNPQSKMWEAKKGETSST